MRNERNLLRHELIGLHAEVVDALNKRLIGVRDAIVDETMKTLVLGTAARRRIPKNGTTFRISIGKATLRVNGTLLIGRPEDRIRKKFKTW